MRIALFQPDIPQNLGSILRTGACFGAEIDVIQPCGFPLSHKSLARAAMDYSDHADVILHADWDAFLASLNDKRLILFTTKASDRADVFRFQSEDVLLFGRESAGAPDYVHTKADIRLRLPMRAGLRSLNLAISASVALTLAYRSAGLFNGLE